MVPTSAAANAPESICPSMATLTTPDRSQSTPPSAPKISGTARKTELLQQPEQRDVVPSPARPAQERRAPTATRTTAEVTQRHRPAAEPAGQRHAASAATQDAERRCAVPAAGTPSVGRLEASPAVENPNAAAPGVAPRPNPTTQSRASGDQHRAADQPVAARQRRVDDAVARRSPRWAMTGALIRSIPSPASGATSPRPAHGNRNTARISGGAAMNSTISDWNTVTSRSGCRCGLHLYPAGLERAEQQAGSTVPPRFRAARAAPR